MSRLLLGLSLVLLSTLAWSAAPDAESHLRVPEKIVPLTDMNAIPMRLTQCNVMGSFDEPQVSRTCDLALQPFSMPIVLREVQVHPAPYAEQSGQLFWAAQCWVRVQLSENGVEFHEIAKFSWPPGDFHSINHVLPVPVGMRASDQAVLRAIVGITSIEPDECRVEVKIYSTAR